MNKLLLTVLVLFWAGSFYCQDNVKTKKILIVATNVNSFGSAGNGTLSWEIAYPFQYFITHGYDIDILTPKGGKVALYDLIVPNDLKKILDSELFLSKTKQSLSPEQVKDTTYIAVFYPGGYGQFSDVVSNTRIADLVTKIYERGGVIATCGHGTASLVNLKLSNTKYLVDGKRMTCFSWAMERKMSPSNYGAGIPFNMEKVLAERGASLVFCPNESKPGRECTVIIDTANRLVTGCSAYEAQAVAEETVRLLK